MQQLHIVSHDNCFFPFPEMEKGGEERKKYGKSEKNLCTIKGRKKMKKEKVRMWEMEQERKQARKDEERHIVIKEKNEEIIQDMIECVPVLALIGSWTLDSGNLSVSLEGTKYLWK